MLIVGNWDLRGASRLFGRDDATGAWTTVTLAQDRPTPNFLPQVRSLGSHRDRETGIDRIVFSGIYDPISPGTHVRSQRCAPRNSVSL